MKRWNFILILLIIERSFAIVLIGDDVQDDYFVNLLPEMIAKDEDEALTIPPSPPSSSSNGRIVNGQPAGAGAFPWMVALYSLENPDGFLPVCGGSLITPSVVLTAAHCIADIQSAEIGRYNYKIRNEEGVERYTNLVREMHPNFEQETFNFDYALIKLERPHPNPYLVDLRRTRGVPLDLQIMGWGLLEEDGEQATELQTAFVKRVSYGDCVQGYAPEDIISANMFCANEENTDSCEADSGGPILVKGTNIQIGLVSWGNGCANPTFPGIYARVSSAIEWIDEKVCTNLAPDECVNGKIAVVNSQGEAQMNQTCQDIVGKFEGIGKKRRKRGCAWVGIRPEKRCKWYGENYCPVTCAVERCQ